MTNIPDPADRQFGATHPNHVRLFHEHQGAYWLNPADPGAATPLEDYMAQEYTQGYSVKSMVAVVNHPTKLRVVTAYDPKAARRAGTTGTDGKPRSPMHIAVFQEDAHQYIAAQGPNQGLTLDQYLDDEMTRGYILRNAVGMVEDSPNPDPPRIRVTTELEHQEPAKGRNRPDQRSAPIRRSHYLQTPKR